MKRALAALVLLLLPCTLFAQYSSVNRFLNLGGSSYLSVPNSGVLNDLSSITIDAWVKPASLGSVMTIVGNDRDNGYWFGVTTTGKLRFEPNPNQFFESKSAIGPGVWTHVAVEYGIEAAVVRFYINGSFDRSVSAPQGWLGYNSTDLRIGADRTKSGPNYYWRGALDEVRIFGQMINFATALGGLYRIPHTVVGGLYGQNLVGAWRMNGNGVDLAQGHHASAVGSVSYLTSPDPPHYSRIGVRYQNSSSTPNFVDYLEIPFKRGLELTNNYTFEMWVKPSSVGGHGQYQTLFCKVLAVAQAYPVWLGINKSNGRLRFVPNGDLPGYMESTASLPTGQWSHVAARFTGSAGKYVATLFINGLPRGSKTYSAPGQNNSASIYLGASATTPQASIIYGYNGLIDELRIWSTARSTQEIADNYRREFNGPAASLEGVYRFDGDVLDSSGDGKHGRNFYGYSQWYFYRTTDLPAEASLSLIEPKDGDTWTIGDDVTIKWNYTGLYNVTIELSRDGGSTWPEILLNAGNASLGSITWRVTGPETADAHVRVRTPTPTGLVDAATKIRIRQPRPILQYYPEALNIIVSRNAPLPEAKPIILANIGGSSLSWTATPSTSDWLAVNPDNGSADNDTFYVRVTRTDLDVGMYNASVQIGGNAENVPVSIPVTLRVTAQKVYAVSGTVRDATGAPMDAIPVSATGEIDKTEITNMDGRYLLEFLPSGNYSVAPTSFFYSSLPTERTYTPLNNFEPGADFVLEPRRGQLLFRYHEGWNLVSIPLDPDEKEIVRLLPDAVPPAYGWDPDSGYVIRGHVEAMKAYWIKFRQRDSVILNGLLIRDMMVPYAENELGWNLFGMPSGPCALSEVMQAPSDMLQSMYEYNPILGYEPPVDGMLRAGKGYFAKIREPGILRVRAREEIVPSPPRILLRHPGVSRIDE